MKRFWLLVVLMALGSSAHAGNSLSFTVGGHRIRIEAPRHCHSASCVSVSIPGIFEARRWRDRFDDGADDEVAAPARPAVAAPAQPAAAAPPPAQVQPVAPASPTFEPAAAVTQEIVAPPPAVQPPLPALPAISPPPPPPVETTRPQPKAAPQVAKVSREADEEAADTPLGDWQSEGSKGTVRIERCGRALCGYAIASPSNDKGEAVLVNMKPKSGSLWTGNVYSHDSGATYYGTMAMTGPNALRVEACALGRFYCSGNLWTRIDAKAERLITSRQISPEPRS
jgi:uncharacterized protein (DUF2147 family)